MDYLQLLHNFWSYFPYLLYAFVFLTLLPKSIGKIVAYASADYEANRNKYHRCYEPEACCHMLVECAPKQKPRKAVTRVYPKRQAEAVNQPVIRRTVQAQKSVNQIAKMFESSALAGPKKINRVTPTILPEIRMYAEELEEEPPQKMQPSSQLTKLLQDDYEKSQTAIGTNEANWHVEPIVTRRKRAVPSTLSFGASSSTTPSTVSPAASSASSPHSSPVLTPVLRTAPLNMRSSLEDIFAAIARSAEVNEDVNYAGCKMLSPVKSIDDILAQRRLSRPLSAYSISDLLTDENTTSMDQGFVENFLSTLTKT